jgi:hypothetical protein
VFMQIKFFFFFYPEGFCPLPWSHSKLIWKD